MTSKDDLRIFICNEIQFLRRRVSFLQDELGRINEIKTKKKRTKQEKVE